MRHTYIFIGLTPSERSLLESVFALDRDGGDQMVPVSRQEDAHVIVANGDDRSVVERLRANHPHALIVLVGQPAGLPVGELPVLRRPLELHAVLDVLSRLDWPRELQDSEPTDFTGTFSPSSTASSPTGRDSAPPVPVAADSSAFAPTTASMPLLLTHSAPPAAGATAAPAALSARATWATSERAPLAPDATRATGKWATTARDAAFTSDRDADVLVVTGALGTRSLTLPRGIRRLGFRVRLVEGADELLAEFAQRPVPFVFLDQASLGDDLLPLARALAAQRPMPEQPPHVAVVARRGSGFDRLRVRLIGCTWMTVPVDRERLLRYFARRGLQRG